MVLEFTVVVGLEIFGLFSPVAGDHEKILLPSIFSEICAAPVLVHFVMTRLSVYGIFGKRRMLLVVVEVQPLEEVTVSVALIMVSLPL